MNAYDNDSMDDETAKRTRNTDPGEQERNEPTGRRKKLRPTKVKKPDDDETMMEKQEDSCGEGRNFENLAKKRKDCDEQEITRPSEDYIAVVGGEIIDGKTTRQQPYGSLTTDCKDLLRHFTKRRFNRSGNNKQGLDHSSSRACLPSRPSPAPTQKQTAFNANRLRHFTKRRFNRSSNNKQGLDHSSSSRACLPSRSPPAPTQKKNTFNANRLENTGGFAQSTPSISSKPRAGLQGNAEQCWNGTGDVATGGRAGNCDSFAFPSSAALAENENNKHTAAIPSSAAPAENENNKQTAVAKSCNGASDVDGTSSSSSASSSSPSSTSDDDQRQFVVPTNDYVVTIEDGSGIGSQFLPTMIQGIGSQFLPTMTQASPFFNSGGSAVPGGISTPAGKRKIGTTKMEFGPGGGGDETEMAIRSNHDASGRRGPSDTTAPSANKIQTLQPDEAITTTAHSPKSKTTTSLTKKQKGAVNPHQ